MADDTNIEDKKVKDGSIFFSYLVVVFFLAVLAVFIVAKALNTAFVEKDRWLALAKTQIMPDRTVLPSRGNIYSYDGKLMATSVPRYYTYLDFKADGFLLDTFYILSGMVWIRCQFICLVSLKTVVLPAIKVICYGV